MSLLRTRRNVHFFKCMRLMCQRLNALAGDVGSSDERVFSGIQPTGVPHLGNYLCAIRSWVNMQQRYRNMMVSIVDLHSITVPQDPAKLRENIQIMAACLLACGINPDKTILFQQSMVPHHSELCWILSCLCTLPRLEHLPQWRDKSQSVKDPKVGLFTYPILQSADILLYKSVLIPVGEDQVTHLELARDLARAFNRNYGPVFPVCEPVIGDVAKVRSLKDPTVKMSKSDANPFSRIELSDSAQLVHDKVKKAVTDSVSTGLTYDPVNRPGLSNLLEVQSLITNTPVDEILTDLQAKGFNKKDYKEYLGTVVNDTVQPIRTEMERLLSDKHYLESVLQHGAEKASSLAETTMKQVRQSVGFQ